MPRIHSEVGVEISTKISPTWYLHAERNFEDAYQTPGDGERVYVVALKELMRYLWQFDTWTDKAKPKVAEWVNENYRQATDATLISDRALETVAKETNLEPAYVVAAFNALKESLNNRGPQR